MDKTSYFDCAAVGSALADYKNEELIYFPNRGNAGDSLIALGTYNFFSKIGVKWTLMDDDTSIDNRILVIGGGGNLVPLYNTVSDLIAKSIGRVKKLILLPHTIRGHKDLILRMDDSCLIFCRDLYSFNYVRSTNHKLDVRLSHDMAFQVDAKNFVKNKKIGNFGYKELSYMLLNSGFEMENITKLPSVDYYREDEESMFSDLSTDLDISNLFAFGVLPDMARLSSWCFLNAISLCSHINTDRLHVAIGASC
ncbi:polysaccharide pyruvyl transferase family protein (plasmid) [Methylobacterium currus]|uniref:Polysaccharide pyruvyl transferase family protein n=1 Tax=Methylobacterium currus TaxID=2051553 RepID=A0A2R4WXB0_9HYPH|nr:polysaccharide pyruvyl transferase family protein [Methylobacterium currus]AWB26150.1 polysaccharide pyruvyl transferase family protein [Methylobacterium currus]